MAGPVRWLSRKPASGGRHCGGSGGVHLGFLYQFLQLRVSAAAASSLWAGADACMQYSHAWFRHCPWCTIGRPGGIWRLADGRVATILLALRSQVIALVFRTALADLRAHFR